jgi:molybdopterin synthase sulfur carrier subunit
MLKILQKTITVKAFGQLTDSTRKAEWQMQAADTDELQAQIGVSYPELLGKNYLLAVNEFIVNENTVLEENDTVALLPPFSGG